MEKSMVGLVVGMALGFAGWFGGFTAFLLVAALGAVGWVAGSLAGDGELRRAFLDRRGRVRRPR